MPTFEKPLVLLCEGEGDRQCFSRLFEHHGLLDQFTVRFPGKEQGGGSGNSGFENFLKAHELSSEYRANVKGVLIISDNDLDPEASFQRVKKQVLDAGLLPPHSANLLGPATKRPRIGILMIPVSGPGNLETYCIEAAYSKWPLQPAVEAYVSSAPAAEWPATRSAKARMQVILAGVCAPRPDANFANHWQCHSDYHVPVGHQIFNPIADFAKHFRDAVLQ